MRENKRGQCERVADRWLKVEEESVRERERVLHRRGWRHPSRCLARATIDQILPSKHTQTQNQRNFEQASQSEAL